jgi:hypothetical protein
MHRTPILIKFSPDISSNESLTKIFICILCFVMHVTSGTNLYLIFIYLFNNTKSTVPSSVITIMNF